jgi:DNA polymerase III subunit delta'|tara:strand:- start:52 stop:990 length:939 start_codon:yes stop_codon:yes gene_type:complete
MIQDPYLQTKLFYLDNYINELIDLHDKKILPNKILLTGRKGSGKSTLAYHLINYILSQNEINSYDVKSNQIYRENKSYKLIKNKIHPNFHLIDLKKDKKNIEINQIREMIEYTSKSSFNNSPRLIMIDNLEFMNVNSINALLKILEEPNHKIYFLLIHNSNEKIYNTLRSRCLPFKINLSFHQSINIANNLLNKDIMNLLNIELMSYYNTPGDFINLINFAEENNLDLSEYSLKNFLLFMINENLYKKSNFVKFNIFSYIELYFLKIFMQNSNKNLINKFYSSFIKKIDTTNKFNLDYESLFIEFKSKILNA